MKSFYFRIFLTFLFLGLPLDVSAQIDYVSDDTDDGIISILGTACEPYEKGESRSSARIKASDKANFNALKNISELTDYKQTFSAHDFNVLVYYIIDNYLEDLTIKTIAQDDEKICVESSAFLSRESILSAFNETFDKFGSAVSNQMEDRIIKQETDDHELVLIQEEGVQNIAVNGLPPKPQPTFIPEMTEDLTETSDSEPAEEISSVNIVINNDKNFAVSHNGGEVDRSYNLPDENDKNIYVYISDTEFFNNTTSADYYDLLKNILSVRNDIKISTDPNEADYLLKSKVLKAKVDPINSQTNRLHLIVSLELKDIVADDTITEHQNRFMLFESSENEQNVAASLMKKMLKKAGENMINNIVHHRRGHLHKESSSAIITPSSSKYGTKH